MMRNALNPYSTLLLYSVQHVDLVYAHFVTNVLDLYSSSPKSLVCLLMILLSKFGYIGRGSYDFFKYWN